MVRVTYLHNSHTQKVMKKILLSTLTIAALGMASYATTFMQVVTDNGETVRYDVNHITEVNFITDDTTTVANHEYVDLGLPSGILWAAYNIGATKPEEFGDSFAWGETEPKEEYEWGTYKYAKTSHSIYVMDSLTKYNFGGPWGYPGVIDSLGTLLSEDDAATSNWGAEWRMPTDEEFKELYNNCQCKETEVNGVYGIQFSATNGNSIFLPAAGYTNGNSIDGIGSWGYYWSSEVYKTCVERAHALDFEKGKASSWGSSLRRRFGASVRAVRSKKQLEADSPTLSGKLE